MEVDINEPKSRGFNIFLRYFQLGLSLIIATQVAKWGQQKCNSSFLQLLQLISYILTGINLLAMIYIRCRDKFPRIQFFILFALDIIACAVVIVMGFVGTGQTNTCAAGLVASRFAFIDAAITVFLSVQILLLPFAWIQRYSNSPGNLTWVLLFLGFAFSDHYKTLNVSIGIIALIISLTTLLVNLIAAIKGTTTSVKKIIIIQWIIALILMIACEVLTVVNYLGNNHKETPTFNDIISNKVLQIFAPTNILQFLFWIWGLMTLTYENGDKIRDALMKGDNDQEYYHPNQDHYEQVEAGEHYGTIK